MNLEKPRQISRHDRRRRERRSRRGKKKFAVRVIELVAASPSASAPTARRGRQQAVAGSAAMARRRRSAPARGRGKGALCGPKSLLTQRAHQGRARCQGRARRPMGSQGEASPRSGSRTGRGGRGAEGEGGSSCARHGADHRRYPEARRLEPSPDRRGAGGAEHPDAKGRRLDGGGGAQCADAGVSADYGKQQISATAF
jgi:hypothetical protein